MTTFLNVEDFDLIIAEPDRTRRAGLACRLYADFEAGALDAGERRAALSIFRAIARDCDRDARARFARFVAASPVLPADLAQRMAQDARAVADAVIRRSPALGEDALVDLAASPEPWRQAAVARRPTVSAPVAAALIEVAGAEACGVLLTNPGARLPSFAFDRLTARFPGHHGLRDAMLGRPDAPGALVEQHLSAVADRLRRFVTAAGWLDEPTATSSAGNALDQALVAYANGRTPEVLAEVVGRWAAAGRISRALIVRAAICGSIGVFEHCAAALARLPVGRVRSLSRDRGAYGLRSMCARMGFGRTLENDLMRVRLARSATVGEDRHALVGPQLCALIGRISDPSFAPGVALSPEAAAVVGDIGRSTISARPLAAGGQGLERAA